MKIIQIMPKFLFGGAEIMCENLTYELKNAGNKVVVISMYDLKTPITKRLEKKGIRVIYLNKKPGFDLTMIAKMRKIFKEEQPNVIHTHSYVMEYAIPASIGLHINRIHTLHSVAAKENTRLGRGLNQVFFKVNKVVPVALSELVRKTIVEEYGISENDIPVIYNGIPLEKCLEKKSYEFKDEINILHIGRFTKAKNHIEMLKAIKLLHNRYPQLKLHFVGDGELKEQILHYISKGNMEPYVEILGTQENVYPILNNADIFLLPSIYEGMPLALIEAMGTGLPIVAGNVGGIPNMIQSGISGVLVSPNYASIAKGIKKFIENESYRIRMGKEAKIASEKFSSKNMMREYLKLYDCCQKK